MNEEQPDRTAEWPAEPEEAAKSSDTPQAEPETLDEPHNPMALADLSTVTAAVNNPDSDRTGEYEPTPNYESEDAAHRPTIPGYEILGVLGRGGMGIVFKARQTGLNRVVALKMILAGSFASPTALLRFQKEAQAVARFQHPNIIQIFEIGEHADTPYFSLELAGGGSLSKKVAKEAQSPHFAATMVEQLARAMHYAHEKGIVHRDLKPANILLMPDGSPKIADFGLVKDLGQDSGATQSGQVLGSPSYMSPEQARGQGDQAGPAADIYALGAILYDLLTGRPPFSGSSVMDTLEMVRNCEPVRPRDLTAKVPLDLETICLKCLEKEPGKRFATAQELADDLRRFLEGRPILARPVSRPEKAWRWAKRNPIGALAVVLAAALFVIPSVLSWQLFLAKESEAAEKRVAQLERDEKEQAREAERLAKEKALAERDEKEKARSVSADQRRLSLDVIRGVTISVDNYMKYDTRHTLVRKQILNKMLSDLQKVSAHAQENPLEDRTEAGVYSRIGEIYFNVGLLQQAGEWFDKAYKILTDVYNKNDQEPANIYNLSTIKLLVGKWDWRYGRGQIAQQRFQESLELRKTHLNAIQELVRTKKAQEDDLIRSMVNLAESYAQLGLSHLSSGQPQEAVNCYLAADKLLATLPRFSGTLEHRRNRADYQVRLGDAKLRLGNRAEAETHYRQALQERMTLVKLTPRPPEYAALVKSDLAQSWLYFGDFWAFQSQPDHPRAEQEYRRSLDLFQALLDDRPDSMELQRRVAALHYRLGVASSPSVRAALVSPHAVEAAAQNHLRIANILRAELAKVDSRDTVFQVELMLVQARLGKTAEAFQIASTLSKTPDRDLQVRFQTVCGLALISGHAPDAKVAEQARSEAMRELLEMIKLGWRDQVSLTLDPDVQSLQSLPEFQKILSSIPINAVAP